MLVMVRMLLLMIIIFFMSTAVAAFPSLWPTNIFTNLDNKITSLAMNHLQHFADKALHQDIITVPTTLSSAGKTDIGDIHLQTSRYALQSADNAAVLALMYQLNGNIKYLNKSKDILLAWANTNHPTGNPIDETRLEGILWAYDLIVDKLNTSEKKIMLAWFSELRNKKINWHFGPLTSKNNHRIHQLKMLLLMDMTLHDNNAVQEDLLNIKKYLGVNLKLANGESIDYEERDALYYHNYVLQPWLTMALVSHENWQVVDRAFIFLLEKIHHHDLNHEFVNSKAPIDAKRGENGFDYAKTNTRFEVTKATPTMLTYYTYHCQAMPTYVQKITDSSKNSAWLAFLNARRVIWLTQIC